MCRSYFFFSEIFTQEKCTGKNEKRTCVESKHCITLIHYLITLCNISCNYFYQPVKLVDVDQYHYFESLQLGRDSFKMLKVRRSAMDN